MRIAGQALPRAAAKRSRSSSVGPLACASAIDAARAGGGGGAGAGAAMIPVPSGVRVWLAVGRTDMRKGMNGLALQVQQALGRDPYVGDLYVLQRCQRR